MWSVSVVVVGVVRRVIRAVLLEAIHLLFASTRPLIQSLVSAVLLIEPKYDPRMGKWI